MNEVCLWIATAAVFAPFVGVLLFYCFLFSLWLEDARAAKKLGSPRHQR